MKETKHFRLISEFSRFFLIEIILSQHFLYRLKFLHQIDIYETDTGLRANLDLASIGYQL